MSRVRSSDQVAQSSSVLILKLRVDGLRSAREVLPYREAETPRIAKAPLLAPSSHVTAPTAQGQWTLPVRSSKSHPGPLAQLSRCEVGTARVATSPCRSSCAPNRLIRYFIRLCGSSSPTTSLTFEAHNSPILCFIAANLTTYLEEPLYPGVFRTSSPAVAHAIALFYLPASHWTPRVRLSYRPARRQCQQIAAENPYLSLPVPLHPCVDSPWRV